SDGGLGRLAEVAIGVRAALLGAGALRHLLDEVLAAAERARLGERTVPGAELALRVAVAAVEELPAPRELADDVADAAIGALDADRLRQLERLDGAALGVAGAPDELPEAPEPDLHRLAALRARAVDPLLLGHLDRAVLGAREVLRVPALGVVLAGDELAATPPLDHHR